MKDATRAQMTARAAAFFAERYPLAYSTSEISLSLALPIRNARRIIADLLKERVIEKYYTAYRLHTRSVDAIVFQKQFVKKEREKDICLSKKK